MLYIECFIIVNGRNIKKKKENFPFLSGGVGNYISRLCPSPLPPPPPPHQKKNTQMGRETNKEGPKHALHRIFDHCEWSVYKKKISFRNLHF